MACWGLEQAGAGAKHVYISLQVSEFPSFHLSRYMYRKLLYICFYFVMHCLISYACLPVLLYSCYGCVCFSGKVWVCVLVCLPWQLISYNLSLHILRLFLLICYNRLKSWNLSTFLRHWSYLRAATVVSFFLCKSMFIVQIYYIYLSKKGSLKSLHSNNRLFDTHLS
jgi:hypothetical protein